MAQARVDEMNSAERWEKIKDVFESALSRAGAERQAFLDGACSGDPAMLREVQSLLASFDADYLEGTAVEEVADAIASLPAEIRPGAIIAQYKIVAELGKGGQGAVYKAVDTKLGREVAIKALPRELTIDETARKRFRREAQLASSLDHPNICAIHDLAEVDGEHFIVMQFVDGRNVRELVNGRPLDLAGALRIGIQVCDALAAAHDRGIIHRDIKAHNVIVTPAGTAKVLDFGLAKLTHAGDADSTELTALGSPYGTPTYAAPEQSRGEIADHRSDIFSIGVLMYEMLTGIWPFQGKTAIDVRHAVMHDEPTPISKRRGDPIPEELDAVVGRAMAKDPDDRIQTAAEMRDALVAVLSELPDSEAAGNSRFLNLHRPLPPQPRRRTTLIAVTVAILLVVLVVGGIIAVRSFRMPFAQTVGRHLTRLTFDPGLQSRPVWSPDGTKIAYYSDKNGNFDIWIQPVAGGDPVQLTDSPANDWQPDFSPDGNSVVFRSERDGGGLFVMPADGGIERKVASLGYEPRWSPDGASILFCNTDMNGAVSPPKIYTIGADGKNRREIWPEASDEFVSYMRADWHSDGKRVSFIGQLRRGDLGFYTVPVEGGPPQISELDVDIRQQIDQAGVTFYDFAWDSQGTSLFLEGEADGVRNLWKVSVEPQTLRWSGNFERLTTGAGKDTEIAVSPDGSKLAFTTQTERTRVWSFPFDAASGKLKGEGKPVTSEGLDTGEFTLSPDGQHLAFVAKRAGKLELWDKSVSDGKERLLLTAAADDVVTSPRWSPDGVRIAFARNHNPDPAHRKFTQTFEKSIIVLDTESGKERQMTSANVLQGWPWDWTSDGRFILGSSAVATAEPEHWGLYLFPLDGAPTAEKTQRLVFDDSRYNIWQGRISPKGDWIMFLAAGVADETDSFIGVVPVTGGSVVQLVRSGDKPRWAADGRSIVFYSDRSGFRNIWSMPFDPVTGRSTAEPTQITAFQTPDKMLIGSPLIGHGSMITDLVAGGDHLFANVTEVSGSIWILDNVNR